MKTQLLGLALFVTTATVVAMYPAPQTSSATTQGAHIVPPVNPIIDQRPKIEVVFVLDTTSSMNGMIQAAKDRIYSIATTMASAQPAPEIKMGLVAFRDRGDAYVTQITDLSSDLDSMYGKLMTVRAEGGGDGPESVNQALYAAVHGISWSQDPDAYRVVFLVGDAPPHMDYPGEVRFPTTLAVAKSKGIIVNTIQCGQDPHTRQTWEQIASLSEGDYFNVDQNGSAIAIATPFDAEIAKLSDALDDTRLYYGSASDKAKQRAKILAFGRLKADAPVAALANRAMFNMSISGEKNFLGEKELVDEVATGRVDLADIEEAELPASLLLMSPAEREPAVKAQVAKRSELRTQMKELAQKRERFLEEKVAEIDDADESLDRKIYDTVRVQGAAKGFEYSAGPKY